MASVSLVVDGEPVALHPLLIKTIVMAAKRGAVGAVAGAVAGGVRESNRVANLPISSFARRIRVRNSAIKGAAIGFGVGFASGLPVKMMSLKGYSPFMKGVRVLLPGTAKLGVGALGGRLLGRRLVKQADSITEWPTAEHEVQHPKINKPKKRAASGRPGRMKSSPRL